MDLRAAVRGAHRRDRCLRAAEVALLSTGAALALGALATLAGAGRAGWALALVIGAACAGWLAARQRARPEDTAAILDARLGLEGALATAFEHAADPSPMARLLLARASRAIDPRRLRAAVPGPSAFAASAALAAAGLLLFALERRPEPPAASDPLAATAQRISALVLAGADEAEGLAAPPRELEEAAKRLAAALRVQDAPEAERAADALLVMLEGRLDQAGEAGAETLRQARELTEELRRLLGPGTDPRGEAGAGGGGGTPLASAGQERRMSGSPLPPAMPNTPPTSAAPASSSGMPGGEAATSAGRWWPRRYDAVVEAWLQAREPR